jgi:DNA repair protein RecO (recombination protein O)
MQGVLQPFYPLLLTWGGRGELATLSAAEVQGSVVRLSGTRLFCGYYLNELLLRLVPRHVPHPGLYQAYEAALYALAAAAEAADRERALRLFEKCLLQESGYGLLLEREAESERPIDPDRLYRYQLEKGPLPYGIQQDPSGASGLQVHGRTLLGLATDHLYDPASLKEAKVLMRAALALYLGAKPLKSREFYREATRLEATRVDPISGLP